MLAVTDAVILAQQVVGRRVRDWLRDDAAGPCRARARDAAERPRRAHRRRAQPRRLRPQQVLLLRAITATSTRATTASPPLRKRARVFILGGILAWTVFAFGGTQAGGIVIPAIACVALAVTCRPPILRRSPNAGLDLCLLVLLIAAALQLIPMPRPLAAALSPAAVRVENAFALVPAAGSRPLTINRPDSAAAVALLAGVLLLFLTARQMFDRGGVRTIVRIIAVTALALSAIALAQDADGEGADVLAVRTGTGGTGPVWPVRQPQSFCDLGDDGGPALRRIPRRTRGGSPAGSRRRVAPEDAQGTRRADLDACGGVDAPGHRHSGVAVTVGARRDDNGCTLCRGPGAPAYGGAGRPCGPGARRL